MTDTQPQGGELREAIERLLDRVRPGPHNTTCSTEKPMVKVSMTLAAANEHVRDLTTILSALPDRGAGAGVLTQQELDEYTRCARADMTARTSTGVIVDGETLLALVSAYRPILSALPERAGEGVEQTDVDALIAEALGSGIPALTERGQVGQVLDLAWPVFGGNHQTAEFWHDFSDAVRFALGVLPSISPPPPAQGSGDQSLIQQANALIQRAIDRGDTGLAMAIAAFRNRALDAIDALAPSTVNQELVELKTEVTRLEAALTRIAFLRPGGPTRNKLAMRMEEAAIAALSRARSQAGDGGEA